MAALKATVSKPTILEQSPILNDPYHEPEYYYATDLDGALNYESIQEGRRPYSEQVPQIPEKQKQMSLGDIRDMDPTYASHIINRIREEVKLWREADYENVTRVTKDLLHFWFKNPERHPEISLFFAQREAIETAIWLNEAAHKSNAGQNILNQLQNAQRKVSEKPADQLPRVAFKMATGTGKTVVMGALILYHFFNRREYRSDTRFADYFLLVAPGITIRDRLHVLKVDVSKKHSRNDYYYERHLVPDRYLPFLDELNAKFVITNYHAFMPRALQGNKRSPMDGKIQTDAEGNKVKVTETESPKQVVQRVMGKLPVGKRLLILNDEAHHCYLPRSKGKTKDTEADENKKAAVWFTGLRTMAKYYKLCHVYDLSATPYYLNGSGYEAYSLFPWVVSDFGLIEAIESGLVKIPFLPDSDDTSKFDSATLKDLYGSLPKNALPKKGQITKKSEAKKEGVKLKEQPPELPRLVKDAFDQFFQHYQEYDQNIRKKGEGAADLTTRPPVFIIVCNNTSVSKEVYKYFAGYEAEDELGQTYPMQGVFPLLSNYDEYDRLKTKPPTLLIDSAELDDTDQVNSDFKKIFSREIEDFKKEYARQYGQGAADRITDAEILREVVNTVGQSGKLGGHIRCVVSVSMLTEGWDANTVTHIAGLRAFGSQLLCEQVAGRALRRRSYLLQGYDKNGQPTSDKRKIVKYKFPPEYAHIIGVPFKLFKGGQTQTAAPRDLTGIKSLPERKDLEIDFPNLIGYRVEVPNEELKYDFSALPHYEIAGDISPMETIMANAFSGDEEKLTVQSVLEKRDQEIIYTLTRALIYFKFSDSDDEKRNPRYQFFGILKTIVTEWYYQRLNVRNRENDPYRKLVYYEDMKSVANHIAKGINTHHNTKEYIRPVFNHYNRWGSTRYVNGNTSKDCYDTEKSHVNKVVMDSDWEGICAKTLEEIPEVEAYVKNQFLGFAIPYVKEGKDKNYFTDFIARLKAPDGTYHNLMIEVTGMNKDKEDKKWYVENRWLPAVNAVREKYGYDQWHFLEIANDIRDIRLQLQDEINSIIHQTARV